MSKKVFPEHKVTLLADDIREEKNGKISLIGIYTGGNIMIEGVLPVAFPKFCFFVRFYDGDGEFKVDCALTGPDGEALLNVKKGMKLIAKKNTYGNLNVFLAPFNIAKEGEYRFTVNLDDKEFCSVNFPITLRKNV